MDQPLPSLQHSRGRSQKDFWAQIQENPGGLEKSAGEGLRPGSRKKGMHCPEMKAEDSREGPVSFKKGMKKTPTFSSPEGREGARTVLGRKARNSPCSLGKEGARIYARLRQIDLFPAFSNPVGFSQESPGRKKPGGTVPKRKFRKLLALWAAICPCLRYGPLVSFGKGHKVRIFLPRFFPPELKA